MATGDTVVFHKKSGTYAIKRGGQLSPGYRSRASALAKIRRINQAGSPAGRAKLAERLQRERLGITKAQQRRGGPFKKVRRGSSGGDGQWVTINGTHVFLGGK